MKSVDTILEGLAPNIDWDKKAAAKAKERNMSKAAILQEWEEAKQKGLAKGNKLHQAKRNEYSDKDNYICYTYSPPTGQDFIYIPERYIVEQGYIYDEKPFVHPSLKFIGIPDRIEVINNKIYITDFKSDKAMYKVAMSVKNGKFITKQKMKPPVSHLDWCNYIKYNLQMSLYMKLVMDCNKKLRFGGLTLAHTIFDEDTLIPIKEDMYNMPYLRKEVDSIIKTL